MLLEQLFKKPVDRAIEGVIKADDNVSLYVELDEYVITNEVAKRLDLFLDAYLNYQGANGVWISGFFGSGKSHLLKMLALLLQNKPIEGIYPLDVFLEKPSFNEEVMFANDLKRAVAIPSESILFNIDQKADVISKIEIDALVAVFVKVFDEHCGYYGKHPYIAQFEREIHSDGQFDTFKAAFLEVSGMDWEKKGRARAKRMAQSIDQAYTKVTGTSVTDILDKYRNDYRLSIEDFADQVNAYVESKGDDFRLNFFVDEVGQYIADNIKLMTNLQTVAESLATKCKGRSWVIVTAQEEFSSVIGEGGAHQSDDFTKIQARFKNRMKLSSQDVAEVIQIRLLDKRPEYIAQLTDLYHAQENNFKTLFDFADASATYPNYKDCEHFIRCYPFIPYQFTLFQSAIQNLSRHSAFEGKHSSVGERSMLGVFQQVAVGIKDHELGDLATFDLMFEGIRTALKGAIQQSVLRAENTLTDEFAVRVLKALFLVKYVKEFKPTIRNVCVLMQDSFSTGLHGLKPRVEEALNLLEIQTYIQRNGEFFEYLTDEEQDVETEIKNTDVDTDVIIGELEKLVFDGVIRNRKIRWDRSGQDYAYTRKLDDNQIGREHELAIHVITSFNDHRDAFAKHKTDTVYNDELRVVLPESERLLRDLGLYKQTEKYISHETRTTQQDSVKRILAEKASQNVERYNQLTQLISKLMGQANYLVAGEELELSGEDGQSKVTRAFVHLIERSYPHLKMLRDQQFSENEIAAILTQGEQGLFVDETQLPESQQEILSYIQSNHHGGIRTSVKSVLEKFEKKPYGWPFAAVLCNLAHLCARAKVEIHESTNLLDDSELARALENTNVHASLLLDPQVEFTQSQIRKTKEFYNEYFEKLPHATEAKVLAKEIQENIIAQRAELERLHNQADRYSFLRALASIISGLTDFESKPYTWFITELPSEADKWFDYKDKVIDPIVKFMKGPSKGHYDSTVQLLIDHKSNLSYIDLSEVEAIKNALADPNIYKGSAIQSLLANTKALKAKLDAKINQERANASQAIDQQESNLIGSSDYQSLDSTQQKQLTLPFTDIQNSINEEVLIAVIRDTRRNFQDFTYARLIEQLAAWTSKPASVDDPVQPGNDEPVEGGTTPIAPLPPTRQEIVSARDVHVSIGKVLLSDEADVDAYIDQYRDALKAQIKQGKKVRV